MREMQQTVARLAQEIQSDSLSQALTASATRGHASEYGREEQQYDNINSDDSEELGQVAITGQYDDQSTTPLDLQLSYAAHTAPEIVILAMGLTGVGKSTFIQAATGDVTVTVGHGLQSSTQNISTHTTTITHPSTLDPVTYRIIDTPGLDDTSRSATDLFLTLVTFLCDLARSDINIDGILYLHRISDDRMSGTSVRALQLFQALAGDAFMDNVVLLTTHWDRVRPHQLALEREAELQEDFWNEMLACGARTERFLRTPESAQQILLGFGANSINTPGRNKLMAIQREIIVDKCELPDTEGGKLLLAKWDEAHNKTQMELEEVQKQLQQERLKQSHWEQADDDSRAIQFVHELMDQEMKLREELNAAIRNQEKLKAMNAREIEKLDIMYRQMLTEATWREQRSGSMWDKVVSLSTRCVRYVFG